MQPDTMSEYVRRRLERWGEVFALARDCEYLGHASKNLLQVLIDHRGEMPSRSIGFKPLEVDAEAQQIEDAVFEIARHAPALGWVLRAYYCGQGRRKIERWETANLLLTTAGLAAVSQPSYLDMARRGTERVHGVLLGTAKAA
ncbi:hypothetical protein [Xanthomonas translucens]|uniref:Uncharacterized protein n=3 Tax=Xanthomonas campestris pv. translucens TaxID=343 RepID=A0A125PWQ4_XANCT|nr:hypothetical protein [Xanthomonas translucens]KWV17150.1 hypothetical protein ATB53_00275 [Xanthomonas translucens]QSQ34694.1 hypothetical protein ISN31_03450 [Xanthomonas translucens pv. translucens]